MKRNEIGELFMSPQPASRVALITGGSRGIGAATALTFAQHGYDVVLTYRNKAARAQEIVEAIIQEGRRSLALACDMTRDEEIQHCFQELQGWTNCLDALILNASGGMERDLVAADPDYPMHINRDAQLRFADAALPLLSWGSTITLVTSHWAHLYGQMEQLPAYEPVAASKYAGEQALRARQDEFARLGIRLLIVTGDLIEGTITPKLLERTAPGLIAQRRAAQGPLPTTTEMGRQIALATLNPALASGSLVVVGASLESML
jgi:NAD(P)-dependent dehydrogenase (short-subunit alcohol dehydrogenase family)